MIASIVIGIVIFGYAGWAFIRHVKKSKEGKCSSCREETSNTSSCCSGKNN
ncbi:FeoB-associated Cys-rich membrane protein [Niallia sp. Sow4_A1]|uniref:FeoB-associated Cys-rich membrane protein n=1 Tax=unclassified Niallia TaxID=2837522 RepID=UPI003F8A2CB5